MVTIKQLQIKQTILDDLDAKMVPLIDNATDLEAENTEAEDTRTNVFEGIAHLKLKLSFCSCTKTQPVPKEFQLSSTLCSK